jgi:hypothetical protein
MTDTTDPSPPSKGPSDEQQTETDTSTATPFNIVYRVQKSTYRRLRFRPRDDGPGWWRFEDEWTGCRWRPVGREVVTDVSWHTSEQE